MPEPNDRQIVYARAEPDDEYDRPDTLDQDLTDEDVVPGYDDEEELDEDEL